MADVNTWDFLDEFCDALKERLQEKAEKYGDTWLQRPRKGQEKRIRDTINLYFEEYFAYGKPVPMLDIAGNAFIGWIRENHPEMWPE